MYNDTKIQMLDLPGIIEGAAGGKGRGREVIAVARSADLVLMVLDAEREQNNQHRNILEKELETMGIRLNQRPPDIYYKVSYSPRLGVLSHFICLLCNVNIRKSLEEE